MQRLLLPNMISWLFPASEKELLNGLILLNVAFLRDFLHHPKKIVASQIYSLPSHSVIARAVVFPHCEAREERSEKKVLMEKLLKCLIENQFNN